MAKAKKKKKLAKSSGKSQKKSKASSKKTTLKKKKKKKSTPLEASKSPRKVLTPEVVEPGEVREEEGWEEPELESPEASSSTAITTSDPLSKYLAELRKYPLLTKEQEFELAKKYYDTGDKSAAEVLVTSNLRFVVKVAAEYSRFGAKLIDLIQEGNVGLMQAVKDFNPYKGVRLITYAVWWIRGYIQEFLMRQYSMVRIGTTANQRKLFYQLQKQTEEFEKLGFNEGVAQLSGRLGIPEEEIKNMHQRLNDRDLSLDQPLSTDSGSLMDFQSDTSEDNLDDQLGSQEEIHLLRERIEEVRPELNERELFLLDYRLLADEPLTLQDIGDKYGITREAVRQMEVRLLNKIKETLLEKIKVAETE